MQITRKWKHKDGTVIVKRYDSVKGVPASEYKRLNEKKYREQKKKNHQQHCEVQRVVKSSRKTKAEQLPEPMINLIKHYREIGLSLDRIAQNFGLTRFVVTTALKL